MPLFQQLDKNRKIEICAHMLCEDSEFIGLRFERNERDFEIQSSVHITLVEFMFSSCKRRVFMNNS